jgi:hypothetical protein
MKSVGFKEWAVVCEALGRGRQSIILRKGGIAEGRDGFTFRYRDFFLFPTWFHEQPEKVRDATVEVPEQVDGIVEIRYAAQLDLWRTIASLEVAEALAPLHILQPDVVRERFRFDEAPGLHIAFVRVFRVTPGWRLPNEPKYGGCRSWISLPDAPATIQFEAVLEEQEHARRREEFLAIVGAEHLRPAPSA